MKFENPHRRYNPLTGEWVMVSPHRARRPWLGQVEKRAPEQIMTYDPDCYLCPGNLRTSGIRNDAYADTFVFNNDFPALLGKDESAGLEEDVQGLLVARPDYGHCRVVCFSPRHDLSLPELPLEKVVRVVQTWRAQSETLAADPEVGYVQVFENKGAMMGCSNPHPHSQIWATHLVPNQPAIEAQRQEDYLHEHRRCLLCNYVDLEMADGSRIVAQNEHFLAVVPFWAVWPFEVLLVSRRHFQSLADLDQVEEQALADVLKQVTTRYDNLFEISFPYSMGFHQAPCDGQTHESWHFHAHFYPPLLRSATVRKFMVGYEMLAMAQRDLTAETAAERLRGLSGVHYKLAEMPG